MKITLTIDTDEEYTDFSNLSGLVDTIMDDLGENPGWDERFDLHVFRTQIAGYRGAHNRKHVATSEIKVVK